MDGAWAGHGRGMERELRRQGGDRSPGRGGTRVVFSMPFKQGLLKRMWHLIEDLFEQGLVVKLFLAIGWLAVVIMLASFVDLLLF